MDKNESAVEKNNKPKKLNLHSSCYTATLESMLAIMNSQGFKNFALYRDRGTRFSSFYDLGGGGD